MYTHYDHEVASEANNVLTNFRIFGKDLVLKHLSNRGWGTSYLVDNDTIVFEFDNKKTTVTKYEILYKDVVYEREEMTALVLTNNAPVHLICLLKLQNYLWHE